MFAAVFAFSADALANEDAVIAVLAAVLAESAALFAISITSSTLLSAVSTSSMSPFSSSIPLIIS